MKISLNWLADYLPENVVADIRSDSKKFAERLTARGLEVEGITDEARAFKNVIVAHLVTRDKHPDSDRLSLCQVNTGSETLQIVCGAQNMKSGDKVVLSMIGAELPNGLKIQKGKIRGVESFGMLCSEVELGLAAESEGIMLLPAEAPVGKPFAEYQNKNDILFELNVTPNRGDCNSHIGIAREVLSLYDLTLQTHEHLVHQVAQRESADKKTSDFVRVSVETDVCKQYSCRVLTGVVVKESPQWLKRRLESIGVRSINNIVDVTNYILFDLGTPLHAFDWGHLKKNEGPTQIVVRQAKSGESIVLLNGETRELTDRNMVIADSNQALAVAGVMGGSASQVTDATTAVLLEAAEFDARSVRKTCKQLGLSSDSSYRFERKIDSRMVSVALDRAALLMADIAGATLASGSVVAQNAGSAALGVPPIRVALAAVNRFLGFSQPLLFTEAESILKSIGFRVLNTASADTFDVEVPSYRNDVHSFEDVAEEILRVKGFDTVPGIVPQLRHFPMSNDLSQKTNQRYQKIAKSKQYLVSAGFCEVVNFAFTRDDTVAAFSKLVVDGEKKQLGRVPLKNPLNEEFATLKSTLLPGVLENYLFAIRHQERDVRLFELRPTFVADTASETGVRETLTLCVVAAGRSLRNGLASQDDTYDFYDIKGILENVLSINRSPTVRMQDLPEALSDASLNLVHPFQSYAIALGKGSCGVIGRIHPEIENKEKLRQPIYFFEIDFGRVLDLGKDKLKVQPISKFPKVERDFSLLAPDVLGVDKVVTTIQKNGRPLLQDVRLVDVYRGEKIPHGLRSLSVAMTFASQEHTLQDVEVDSVCQKVLAALEKELSVVLRTL